MKRYIVYLICLIIGTSLTASRDNAHFYRATNFFGEPRLENPWLTTLDITFGGGSTSKALNGKGKTVPLLDVYGPHNMHLLGVNVPGQDINNPYDIILQDLALIAGRDQFGYLSFNGEFSIFETNIFFIQNFTSGLFVQLHVPVRSIRVNNICQCDLSPTDPVCPNNQDPTWQLFLQNFTDILCRYGLSMQSIDKSGIGDVSLQLGWAYNYQDTDVLDFIDITLKSGILFSTSSRKHENSVFDIPLGYNGHSAIPVSCDLAFGTYDWLTIGGHLGALFFFDDCADIRMKTHQKQSGLFKLACGRASIHQGTLWEAGGYLKADHIIRGFSLLFGYSYVNQQADMLTAADPRVFPCTVINSDEMYDRWKMHTIHVRAEYDFTQEHSWVGPRIGIFYNQPVGGKHIFRTGMAGGECGIDIAWVLD